MKKARTLRSRGFPRIHCKPLPMLGSFRCDPACKAIPNALKGKVGYVTSTWLQNQVCLALYICSPAVRRESVRLKNKLYTNCISYDLLNPPAEERCVADGGIFFMNKLKDTRLLDGKYSATFRMISVGRSSKVFRTDPTGNCQLPPKASEMVSLSHRA